MTKKILKFSAVGLILAITFMGAIGVVASNYCRSNYASTRLQMAELSRTFDMFHTDCGRYPTADEGLWALMRQPENCSDWGPEPYIKGYKPRVLGCREKDFLNIQRTLEAKVISVPTFWSFVIHCAQLEDNDKTPRTLPRDAWGNEFAYQIDSTGENFNIVSFGRDGLPGGEGVDRDIETLDDGN